MPTSARLKHHQAIMRLCVAMLVEYHRQHEEHPTEKKKKKNTE